jgi:hypothetical protein
MKLLGILFVVLFLTSCAQNVGYGLGVAGIAATGNNIAATEIIADSETGIHGSVGIGTDIGL